MGAKLPPTGIPANLRAVFFDAGNTLLHINCERLSDLLGECGLSLPAERVQIAEYRARPRISRFLHGTASMESEVIFRRYVDFIVDEAKVAIADGERDRVFRRFMETHRRDNLWDRRDPDAEAVLGRLRQHHTVAVISNADGRVEALLEERGLRHLLDFVIDSTVVGLEKPDPRIFELGLRRAGVRADQAIYIGDIHAIDIIGAHRAGVPAILLDPIGCYGDEADCPRARNLLEVEALIAGGKPPSLRS